MGRMLGKRTEQQVLSDLCYVTLDLALRLDTAKNEDVDLVVLAERFERVGVVLRKLDRVPK